LFGVHRVKIDDWATPVSFLHDKIQHKKTLVLFDKISCMGSKDPDFLGKFKNAWNIYFKKNNKLIFILCRSISS
jgi:uncharacterized protein